MRLQTLAYDERPYAALVCRVYGLHLLNPCNYVDYYSFTDTEGMAGWVGRVARAVQLSTELCAIQFSVTVTVVSLGW